jgi:hypothetical protein
MADRFDVNSLSQDPELVAKLVPADAVFSFLSRQVSVPPACVALVWGETGQPTVARSGRAIESGEVRELLFVRTVPFSVEDQVGGLTSQDGYAFTATIKFTVQVVPGRAELAAFRKAVLGSSNEVKVDHLRQHCEEVVRAALTVFSGERKAAELASGATGSEFDDALAERFKSVGFESGLALGPDPRVTFDSPAFAESRRAAETATLRRKRLEADEQLGDLSAKAREKRLAEVGALLERVKDLARQQPGVAVADLIKTFDAGQRGALYEGLMEANQPQRRTEAIIAVAGDELLWFDPAKPGRPTRRRDLSSDAGALRSVRLAGDGGERVLLVGAQRGVHLVGLDDRPHRTFMLDAPSEVRGAVNAAVLLGDHIYATHRDFGLVRWGRDRAEKHELCLGEVTGGAKSVRDVQADGAGRLWFGVDDRVVGWSPTGDESPVILSAPAVVRVLLVAECWVIAGLQNGGIVRWSTSDPTDREEIRGPTGDAVRSLDWCRGGGVPRLLIADLGPQLDLQVLGDSYRGEYRSRWRIRWGFAGEDIIVGVSDIYDRLLIWRMDAPNEPAASISVGELLQLDIQDVALLPTTTAGEASVSFVGRENHEP